jgi:hypothetical protein
MSTKETNNVSPIMQEKPSASFINFIPSKINTKCMLIIIIIINFRLVNGSSFLHPSQCLEFFWGKIIFSIPF